MASSSMDTICLHPSSDDNDIGWWHWPHNGFLRTDPRLQFLLVCVATTAAFLKWAYASAALQCLPSDVNEILVWLHELVAAGNGGVDVLFRLILYLEWEFRQRSLRSPGILEYCRQTQVDGYAHIEPPCDYCDLNGHERMAGRGQDVDELMRDYRNDNHQMPDEQPSCTYLEDTIEGPLNNEDKGSKIIDPIDTIRKYSVDSNCDEGGAYGDFYQASVKTKELSEGSPPKLNHFPLLQLPQEIRDQIYGYVVELHTPMSDRESSFKCPSNCCASKHKPNHATWERQFDEIRNNYCNVSKQFHDELLEVFFRVNSWALHRARLREDANSEPTTLTNDSQSMCGNYWNGDYITYFKHLNMQIFLAPSAIVDLCTPKDVFGFSTSADLLAYQMRQDPEEFHKHTLNEEAQCEMYRNALEGLVSKQKKCFPSLKTLTLEISLHAPQATRSSTLTRNLEDRCGITFEVKVFLNTSVFPEHRRRTFRENFVGPGNRFCIETIEPNTLEPRRRMLSPLAGLDGVYRVQVKRRWVVLHRPKGTMPIRYVADDGAIEEDNVLASHMAQRHTFSSVEEMLETATTDFKLFQVTGLKEYGIAEWDVIEILENEGNGELLNTY